MSRGDSYFLFVNANFITVLSLSSSLNRDGEPSTRENWFSIKKSLDYFNDPYLSYVRLMIFITMLFPCAIIKVAENEFLKS